MARPNRRPRIIGPFFLIAILLSAGVFYWQKQKNEMRLQNAPRPVVEHQVIAAPQTQSAPSPEVLSIHAKELGLNEAQAKRIEPLVKAYLAELKPLQAETQAAAKRFEAYQQAKAESRQVPMAELQAQMGELSALSSRMVSLRQQYWGEIAPILTEQQRWRARELWRQSLMPAKGQEKQ